MERFIGRLQDGMYSSRPLYRDTAPVISLMDSFDFVRGKGLTQKYMKLTITSFVLILLLRISPAIGQESQIVGKAVYLIYSCTIRTLPRWEGEVIEDAKPGAMFTVLAVEEDDWYKVKTKSGAVGYVSASWVTDDIRVIEKQKADEVRKRAEQKQSYQNKLNVLRKKHPKWSSKDCELILQGKVRIGMNMEQCRAAWGTPDHESNTTFSFGTHAQWCYGEYCSSALYFENGILTVIQN